MASMDTLKQLTLLVVTHVPVKRVGDLVYMDGATGLYIDEMASYWSRIVLFSSCVQGSDHSQTQMYQLKSCNVSVVCVPYYLHAVRPLRYAKMALVSILSVLRLLPWLYKCDVIHSRLPSVVGNVGAVLAKVTGRPRFCYLAGDWAGYVQSIHRGRGAKLAGAAVAHFMRWVSRGSICFTAGKRLSEQLGGGSNVVPVYTSSLDEHHVVAPEVALNHVSVHNALILFVGGVGPAKGVDTLLEAVHQLIQSGYPVRLRIIGSVPDGGKWLRAHVQVLDLEDIVEYHPPMPWEALLHQYDQSDLVVLPSRMEGIPKVPLEAMARGIPVVATHVGGIPELVIHEQNGLLVPPGDVVALAEAMQRALSDRSWRRRAVLAGLGTAKIRTVEPLTRLMMDAVAASMSAGSN